jgi:hypothetical protein
MVLVVAVQVAAFLAVVVAEVAVAVVVPVDFLREQTFVL